MKLSRVVIIILGLAVSSLVACDSAGSKAATRDGAKGDKPAAAKVEKVVVAKEGTKFDPPVEVSQMPAGVWYCDMGTVHYARQDEGDGKCPECGMKLKPAVE